MGFAPERELDLRGGVFSCLGYGGSICQAIGRSWLGLRGFVAAGEHGEAEQDCVDHDFRSPAQGARSPGRCRRCFGLAIEWLGNRLHEAEVVNEQAGRADHEVAVFGDRQVIDLLGRSGLD